MIALSLDDAASPALAAAPDRLRAALADKAYALAAALQGKINEKLSGAVLNQKSGALVRSITTTLDSGSGGVTVTLATAPDIKYAAIHEYGGTIAPHQIVPDKARALAFIVGGKQVFAARVNLPAIAMPERSYMRTSLAEMADEIRDRLSEAAIEAMA